MSALWGSGLGGEIPVRDGRDRRCLILANPLAGGLKLRERSGRLLNRLASMFLDEPLIPEAQPVILSDLAVMAADLGLTADVEPMPSPHNMQSILRSALAQGYDTVVAAGGDGSVHSVAQSLVGTHVRLGILPVGTANNIAHSLGIPFQLEDAMRVVAANYERTMDVGTTGTEFFIEGAGVGLFADMLNAVGKDELRKYQLIRMWKVLSPILLNPRARRLQIALDGEDHNEDAVMVTVANSTYIGESMAISPGASVSDGLFDVVIVGALDRRELIQFGRALFRGTHLQLPKVKRLRATTVEIRRRRQDRKPLVVHADDHMIGGTPVRFDVKPAALRVLVPPPSDRQN